MRITIHRREGQALVLAALMVLVLSIATLATINIGHNITERVRLQNTADAAAYSMAAMEARAFNFYAFANRTQVSHYVAAMVWQSMLSFAYFLEAVFTDLLGVILTADVCGVGVSPSPEWGLICAAAKLLPAPWGALLQGFFAALTNIATVVEGAVKALQGTLANSHLDWAIGTVVIPAHQLLNKALAGLAELTLAGTMENVLSTSQDVIQDNDNNIDSSATRFLSGALSVCILERAHMQEAGVSGGNGLGNVFVPLTPAVVDEDNKVSIAKRSMGKISNATRFACDRSGGGSLCGPGWVTERTAGKLIPLPSNFGVVRDLVDKIDWKWGQTKMLSYGYSVGKDNQGADRNYIRDWKTDFKKIPAADLAQGDAIGSDDIYEIKLGPDSIGVSLPIVGKVEIDNPFTCKKEDDSLKCWGDNRKGLGDSPSADLPYMHTVKPSIWAMSPGENGGKAGGLHWRVVTAAWPVTGAQAGDLPNFRDGAQANIHRDVGLNVWEKKVWDFLITVPLPVWVANTRRIADGNHPWEGLARFPHFEPGQYEKPCSLLGQNLGVGPDPKSAAATRKTEFNQPSTWALLNKTPAQLQNPKKPDTGAGTNKPALLNNTGALSFTMSKPAKIVFDNKKMNLLGYTGMTVLSRGQTYYHRPGNWAEQPNFFNPYWKPRLASVWQGRYALPSLISDVAAALPAPLNGLPPKIITH